MLSKIKNWINENVRWPGKPPEKTVVKNQVHFGGSGSLDDNYLFDFKNYSADSGGWITDEQTSAEAGQNKKTPKLSVTPKEILDELETDPNPFNLNNLDDKIEVLQRKSDLISQDYAKREVDALIDRLENRKQYSDHSEFFNQFKNTTDEKIAAFMGKYTHLRQKKADIFIPEFPDEAIDVMDDYNEKVEEITGQKAVFYVIAREEDFEKSYEKRDPILLVQSPFGFFWQILGAWDEEMLLVSEL